MKLLFPEAEVTISLSNLIKAYHIRYTNEKKKIDLNEQAQEKQQEYLKRLAQLGLSKEVTKDTFSAMEEGETPEDGFVPGFGALPIIEEKEEEKEFLLDEGQMEALMEPRSQLSEKLEREARELLEEAKIEAERLLQTAEAEAEFRKREILQTAKSEGYEAGYRKAFLEMEESKQTLLLQQKQLEEEYEEKVKSLEPTFVDLVIGLVQKLTGVLVTEQKEIIAHVIDQMMLKYDSSNSYIIRVSEEDFEYASSLKRQIKKQLKEHCIVEVIEDKMLQKAQCMIETDTRIIDCSLDTQMRNLFLNMKLLAGEEQGNANG